MQIRLDIAYRRVVQNLVMIHNITNSKSVRSLSRSLRQALGWNMKLTPKNNIP